MWELRVYEDHFGGGFSSYEVHFRAAEKGAKLSIDRMNITADLCIVHRMKHGGEHRDERFAHKHATRGFMKYG